MNFLQKIKRPPWRTIVPGCALLLLVAIGYALWSPGLDIKDGRNDRAHNGIWIAHGWFAAPSWFAINGKEDQMAHYQNQAEIRGLAESLKSHHITDVFPHLCPADERGRLPAIDANKVEAFLDELNGFRVMPWVGGPGGVQVRLNDKKWRAGFISSIQELFRAHPRLAGVHLNIEPLNSGDANFLQLLDELRAAIPKEKVLFIAAYPPPTRFQPYEDIHWSEDYFREVARRSDQMVVMMYDTALRKPKFYQYLMAQWTGEVLAWSDKRKVLLGLPAYDESEDYHDPKVENLENALMGVHRGLSHGELPQDYQGISIYSEWEMDAAKWRYLEKHFLKM